MVYMHSDSAVKMLVLQQCIKALKTCQTRKWHTEPHAKYHEGNIKIRAGDEDKLEY